LQYRKWSLSYKRLFAKNNTNSYVVTPTGLTANGKELKISKGTGTSNLLLFERNSAKDYKDTAKISTVGNNYAIEI